MKPDPSVAAMDPVSALCTRMAIRETLEAYFSSVDRRDWTAYGDCFAEDAEVEFNRADEPPVIGRAAMIRRASERQNRPVSNHLLSNTHICVAGDRATAITHAVAHLMVAVPGAPGRIVVRGIVYDDALSIGTDGRWRISRRIHRPLWQFEAPSMPKGY